MNAAESGVGGGWGGLWLVTSETLSDGWLVHVSEPCTGPSSLSLCKSTHLLPWEGNTRLGSEQESVSPAPGGGVSWAGLGRAARGQPPTGLPHSGAGGFNRAHTPQPAFHRAETFSSDTYKNGLFSLNGFFSALKSLCFSEH